MSSSSKRRKLYLLTAADFQAYSHTEWNGRPKVAKAENVPMLRWPDGRWCLAANIYIQELYDRGLSRRGRGGSLLTYATQITHLIHFCYKNQTDFIDLTDSQFALFIKTLQGEKSVSLISTAKRDANSVIDIGRRCIDFLMSVATFHRYDDFIGPKGRIRVKRKTFTLKLESSGQKGIVKTYWHHRAFPTPDVEKKRLPISDENVKKLRASVVKAGGTTFLRKRRYVMLLLMEITGARRIEVASITVDSVLKAAQMSEPALRFATVKQGGNQTTERMIPITTPDLMLLLEYIKVNRRPIVRKTCGIANDDGFLLVNQNTGKGITANTITLEIYLLRKLAGIIEKACGHMFRHRFVTKLLIALIEQHNLENPDDFRRALVDIKGLKQQIQQWTGHKNIHSLDPYIHIAFASYSRLAKSINHIHMRQAIASTRTAAQQLVQEIIEGLSPLKASRQVIELINALDSDLERLSEG